MKESTFITDNTYVNQANHHEQQRRFFGSLGTENEAEVMPELGGLRLALHGTRLGTAAYTTVLGGTAVQCDLVGGVPCC